MFSLLCGARAQITETGEIARTFTITDRDTGLPIELGDFEGQVLVLDFFAYWCGPCRTSSPDLEQNVNHYYVTRGGNAHGVPVAVLPVNIEPTNPSQTDAFINDFGLGRVAEDFANDQAYAQFATGFIPLFVIINGVAGSASHQQWEVLFRDSGYPGAHAIRAIVDQVEPSLADTPPFFVESPQNASVRAGQSARFSARAAGTPPFAFQWFHNGAPVDGAQSAVLEIPEAQLADRGSYSLRVTNDHGTGQSDPVTLIVRLMGPTELFQFSGPPLSIPDATPQGVASTIQVNSDLEIQRIRARVSINHTYAGDLTVTLRSPEGTELILAETSFENSDSSLELDLETDAFRGESPMGAWQLHVADLLDFDTGELTSWSLLIEGAALTEPPKLEILRADQADAGLQFRWQAAAADWILQAADRLGGAWIDLPGPAPDILGDHCRAPAPNPAGSTRFYRLRRPE